MIAARVPPPLRAACDDGFLAFLFAEPLDYGAVRALTAARWPPLTRNQYCALCTFVQSVSR
jgi:hypothetical protein